MIDPAATDMPEIGRLALTSARSRDRDLFALVVGLDARLGKIVASTTEPMLGQLRLAWWRDQLSADNLAEHRGEPLLEAVAAVWGKDATGLVALVDGWEGFLLSRDGDSRGWEAVAGGRAEVFGSLSRRIGSTAEIAQIGVATRRWTFAELGLDRATPDAASDPAVAAMVSSRLDLDRAMRPLAVLDGLARRALLRKDADPMGGRGFPFAAMRLGIFGR